MDATVRLRDDRALWGAAIVGAALRIGWLLVARPTPISDYASYRKLADDVLHLRFHSDGVPTARRTIGYPAALALPSAISNSPLFLGFVNCLFATALIVAVAYAARAFGLDRRAGNVAVWAVALNPTFVFYAAVLASENLQLPVLVLGTALALRTGDGSGRSTTIGFVVLGLATLIRAESAVFVAVVVGILLVRRVSLRRVAVLGAVSVVVVLPWVVRNEIQVGRGAGIATTSGENFYFAHGQDDRYGSQPYSATEIEIADEVERSREGFRIAMRKIGDDPLRLVDDAWQGTRGFFGWPDYAVEYSTAKSGDREKGLLPLSVRQSTFDTARTVVRVGHVVLMVGFGAGLVLVWQRRFRPLLPLVALIAASWFVTAVVFFAKSRFRLAAEPFMILLAAGTLVPALRTLWPGRARHTWGPAITTEGGPA